MFNRVLVFEWKPKCPLTLLKCSFNKNINVIDDYIFSDNNTDKPSLNKYTFVKLLCLDGEGLFLYKDCLNKQIDGFIIWSPLRPTIAKFFFKYMETKKIRFLCMSTQILRAREWMIVLLSLIITAFLNFLSLLDSQHNNIKFTMEPA